MDRKALIIFPDEWLQFSPTVINMHRCLTEDGFDVTVLAADNGCFRNDGLVDGLVKVNTSGIASRIARKTGRYRDFKFRRICAVLDNLLKKQTGYKLVIGVDAIGYCAARRRFNTAAFLSLEVEKGKYFQHALQSGINHLIIQTEERKEYLIGSESDIPVSYIQNAPILPASLPTPVADKPRQLLYLGKSDFKYGLENVIASLYYLDKSYTLTLKGFGSDNFLSFIRDNHPSLLSEKRLLFDFEYVPQEKIISSIAAYYIAFTAYDPELAKADFNYYSSPAGKLFNYYAAGLPVVGIDIPGLKSVAGYGAGILLKEASPEAIADAVRGMSANYQQFARNAQRAALDFDFRKAYSRFIESYGN